jgi:hypothetical protein
LRFVPSHPNNSSLQEPGFSRRRLFGSAAKAMAFLTAARAMGASTLQRSSRPARAAKPTTRAIEAYVRRMRAAELERDAPRVAHKTNGDRHLGGFAIYSKGLPHDAKRGEPDPAALKILLAAIESGRHEQFETVPLGGYLKLADPQAAFAYDLIGPDSQQIAIPPPPAFSSAEQAAEMVEIYWHALLRDVPFDQYATNPLVAKAAAELSALKGYHGARDGGRVTPQLLFRGTTKGGSIGPYTSQFLLRDLPWTPIRVPQKIRTAVPNRDYMLDEQHWLAVQNGALAEDTAFSETPTYIRTGRDLSEYVHRDFTYQAFLGAALMLFKMSAPIDGGVPYDYSISQSGFVTFGPSDILHLVGVVANVALKAAWFQKWRLHMRIRPEEYGGRVQKQLSGTASYPLHLDLLNSAALGLTRSRFGTAFAPQAYPEGAPLHPSYPAGHAVIAGACATVLKACFAESFIIPQPSVPGNDGQSLRRYTESGLTVGNELDKLAENISFARDFAGLHWRSDASAGILLGESVAIGVLREMRMTSHELFDGYELTRFDGTRITVR